jgi:hypothetical protein
LYFAPQWAQTAEIIVVTVLPHLFFALVGAQSVIGPATAGFKSAELSAETNPYDGDEVG